MGTEFVAYKTEVPGLLVLDASLMPDDRGYFQEKFHKAKLVAAGLPATFEAVQQNITLNYKAGVTRGMHAEAWDKYVSVVNGRVFCAFADLRKGKTFGRVVTVEVTPTKAVFVPRGVAASYQCLEPNTYYIYSMGDHPSPDTKQVGVNVADKNLAIKWPIPLNKAIISERDQNQPSLSDALALEF
jgi:dTDP-4-dehydrorhamnose 3,5-epimerase